MNDNETNSQKLGRIRVQIMAIRYAQHYLRVCDWGPKLMALDDELNLLKKEYRYLTYEKNHGSLAAEMVVGREVS